MVFDIFSSHFRPKLLSRLDKIVVFDPLSHSQLDEESCQPRDGGCSCEACQKGHYDHGGGGILEEAYDHEAIPITHQNRLEKKVVELPKALVNG